MHISADGTVSEIAVISHHGYEPLPTIGGIAVARDGTIWFTEANANRIAALGTNGSLREYREGIPSGTTPVGICVDEDETIWFTDPTRETIGHISPVNGGVRIFGSGLSPMSIPGPPVLTSDGAVWFAETNSFHQRIARIATNGALVEFAYIDNQYWPWLQPAGAAVAFESIPGRYTYNDPHALDLAPHVMMLAPNGKTMRIQTTAPGCDAAKWIVLCLLGRHEDRWLRSPSIYGDDLVLGPDRNLWFADGLHGAIGRVTPAGGITYFTRGLTRWNSGPQHFTVGPDGAVWFTEIRSRVGRITMDGRITEFSAGIPRRSFLGGIVTGPDKNLWFTLYHGNELGRITPRGIVTRFRRGIYPSRGIDSGTVDAVPFVDRAGHIWFNEPQGGRIARATVFP